MKHLQKMYEMCTDDMGYFKELIEAIIRIESETTSKDKFKIWDYVGKDSIRPAMSCVFHDSGFKVATDARILIALKEEYDPELEGLLLRKNGTIETEHTKYPKWRNVIPNPEITKMESVELDFGKIRGFEKDYKAICKARGYKDAPAYIRVTDKYTFNLALLVKMVKFMEHTGTRELLLDPDGRRAALVVAGESRGILMPCYDPNIEGEFVYRLY